MTPRSLDDSNLTPQKKKYRFNQTTVQRLDGQNLSLGNENKNDKVTRAVRGFSTVE